MIADGWKDYEIIATGGGEKLERWGNVILLRPDPQVIWNAKFDLKSYKGLNARYVRSSSGGGAWQTYTKFPDEWIVSYKNLKFLIKPMGFKHTGLFPEQAANWDLMTAAVSRSKVPVNALNLFGYTGGATAALAAAGASVTHIDAAKGMVDRCKLNCKLSNVKEDAVRYIVDDCKKFVLREIKRGKKYNAVLMDPPSYGRGPNGEMWKLEDSLFELVSLVNQVVDNPVFFLINSYTTGLQPTVLSNILNIVLGGSKGKVDAYEVGLNTKEKGIVLPCGASGLYLAD